MVHPLLEAGLGKDEVRALARRLGVPSAEKAASPCLASRVPYGTAVDPGTLARIDRAERAVRALGYGPPLRVRHHGVLGRVELAARTCPRARPRAGDRRRRCGTRATRARSIDREPFRSGRLNAVLRNRA